MVDPASPTESAPAPHGGQPVVTSGAPRGATDVVVLALHGRGATAQGVVNLLDPIYRHGVTFLAPDAYRSRWFSNAALVAPSETDAVDEPGEPGEPTVRELNEPERSSAIAVVDALVAHATDHFGVPRERVVLAGFSQGAVVAAEYLLAHPGRHGAVALLSGAAIDPGVAGRTLEDGERDLDGTPVLLGVGRDDPHVPLDTVSATADALRALGASVDERTYDDVGHEVTDDEFAWLRDRIDALLDQ